MRITLLLLYEFLSRYFSATAQCMHSEHGQPAVWVVAGHVDRSGRPSRHALHVRWVATPRRRWLVRQTRPTAQAVRGVGDSCFRSAQTV